MCHLHVKNTIWTSIFIWPDYLDIDFHESIYVNIDYGLAGPSEHPFSWEQPYVQTIWIHISMWPYHRNIHFHMSKSYEWRFPYGQIIWISFSMGPNHKNTHFHFHVTKTSEHQFHVTKSSEYPFPNDQNIWTMISMWPNQLNIHSHATEPPKNAFPCNQTNNFHMKYNDQLNIHSSIHIILFNFNFLQV